MKVFSHQASAHNELLSRARTFFAGHWRTLPIKTRWHSLLVGPTGSGKTALGAMISEEVQASLLRISVPGWMPSGANNKAVAETLITVIDHVYRNPKSILFLDELDKLWHETAWHSHIRGELFDLLDSRIPDGARWSGGDGDLEVGRDCLLSAEQKGILAGKLASSVFVIGAGTFQEFYDGPTASRRIGFQRETPGSPEGYGPSSDYITRRLPRELVNRFNSRIVVLPQLASADYEAIAQQAEDSLPAWLGPAFRDAARHRMAQAISSQAGCRFVEESLMDALQRVEPPQAPAEDDAFASIDDTFDFEM